MTAATITKPHEVTVEAFVTALCELPATTQTFTLTTPHPAGDLHTPQGVYCHLAGIDTDGLHTIPKRCLPGWCTPQQRDAMQAAHDIYRWTAGKVAGWVLAGMPVNQHNGYPMPFEGLMMQRPQQAALGGNQ